jgi:uncharacterized hydrophobic protein (TIGR00271 family)
MSPQSTGTLVALLGPDLDVTVQMRWAVRLATARQLDLLILQSVESPDERVVEVSLDKPSKKEATDIIPAVRRLIEDSPDLRAGPRASANLEEDQEDKKSHIVHVRFKRIHFASLRSLRQFVLAELGRSNIKLFTVARKQPLERLDVNLVSERQYFLRYIPCEVVFCQGLKEGKALSRILVAAASGPDGKAAMRLGLDLAATANGTVTALHVNPSVGLESELVGERRLDRFLKNSLGTEHPAVIRRVVVDDQVHSGVRRVWEEGNHDVVVVGAPPDQIERNFGTKLGKDVTVVIVSAASPIINRLREFVEEGIQRLVPQIQRVDRVALVDRVQSSAAWNFDFVALMVLSTIMAAIGLIQNSAAVVIGAMLVAPLMTPLLGLGLALEQGNPMLARLALRSITLGLCVSLFGGFLVGLSTPSLEEPTRQMLARGGPRLLDLLVAFAAGLAAAYASSRPGLIAALPGVAIAAALVPPIATSGLALSLGDFSLAMGALLLFAINMVTIVLASQMSLWAVGFRYLKKKSRLTLMVGISIIVAVLGLGVYLSLQEREYALTKELPAGLMETVQESLAGTGYRLDNLAVAYDEIGLQLNVLVAGKKPMSGKLATGIRTAANNHYYQPVRVRLMTRIETEVDPVK